MIRELDKLPTTGHYRMYGKARDKQPKAEIIAEAEKHSEDVIWIDSMGAAFVPMTMDDYESEGE
jgi:hypothetical protein